MTSNDDEKEEKHDVAVETDNVKAQSPSSISVLSSTVALEDRASPVRLPSTFNDSDHSPLCGLLDVYNNITGTQRHVRSSSSGSIPFLEQSVCDEDDFVNSTVNVEDEEITAAIKSLRTPSISYIGRVRYRSASCDEIETIDELKSNYNPEQKQKHRKKKNRKQRKRSPTPNQYALTFSFFCGQ